MIAEALGWVCLVSALELGRWLSCDITDAYRRPRP